MNNFSDHPKIQLEAEAQAAVRDLLRTDWPLAEIAKSLVDLLESTKGMDLREIVVKLAMAYGIHRAYRRIEQDAEFALRPIAPGLSTLTFGDIARREQK